MTRAKVSHTWSVGDQSMFMVWVEIEERVIPSQVDWPKPCGVGL